MDRSLTSLIVGHRPQPSKDGHHDDTVGVICVTVETVIVDGDQRTVLTDWGLETVSRRCPQLRRLQIRRCRMVTDRGLGHVVERCTSLQRIDVTGKVECCSHLLRI